MINYNDYVLECADFCVKPMPESRFEFEQRIEMESIELAHKIQMQVDELDETINAIARGEM